MYKHVCIFIYFEAKHWVSHFAFARNKYELLYSENRNLANAEVYNNIISDQTVLNTQQERINK